jgi:hypothetical protein
MPPRFILEDFGKVNAVGACRLPYEERLVPDNGTSADHEWDFEPSHQQLLRL